MNNEIINNLLSQLEEDTNRLLTFEEEQQLFQIYEENECLREDIQIIMIKANIKLIYSIAKSYYPIVNVSYDEIIQFGMIGVSKAVDKFDYHLGTKFSTYATYWIKKSISRSLKNALFDFDKSIKATELKKMYQLVEEQLTTSLKRRVTVNEIANKMGIDSSELILLNRSGGIYSLDTENADTNSSMIDKIIDTNPTPYEIIEIDEKNKIIDFAIASLKEIEREIIRYRYGYEDGIYHSFSEVANKFNLSKQRCQVIERNALKKMREFVEDIE